MSKPMKNTKEIGAPAEMKRPPKAPKGTMMRILRTLYHAYPVLVPLTAVCILFSAAISAIPAIFMQRVFSLIDVWQADGDVAGAMKELVPAILILAGLYLLSIIAITLYNQLMAYITQGFLHKLRTGMFEKMQSLPLRYFDTNKHGEIMSRYTNDVDTLRELVSRSLPTLLQSCTIILTVLFIMIYYSIPMTLVVLLGVVAMLFVSKKVGGGSARFFVAQQRAVAEAEGFFQEMMSGQKVIKVFCHEEESYRDFEKINEGLCHASANAHGYANILGPIIANIGNVLYAVIATVGGIFLATGAPNLSLSGMAFGIAIVVPFLNMTKQFTGNVNMFSQQISSIVMGLAGASRVFALQDEIPETDEGYVTLVNARMGEDGALVECAERTGLWAWRHPHGDGSVTYTRLCGDVRLSDVDFGYVPEKTVLHGITLCAEPGQKVAFVGATGAGKTTITNLLNRFYDIADGKIRYDGININKIKKADLRRSLGIVLQETNLFTGSVMENIRYGKLDATDEECIAAAKLAGADDFITRLPEGYATELSGNGANLSQGQRQLIAIARAAVADPPVMILDEATSSIDTHTEAIVQRGMDKLMEGRTVFVIAHRLSTVKNADMIMVLDHGNIIERGNHDSLIAEKGVYYQLYTGAFELE